MGKRHNFEKLDTYIRDLKIQGYSIRDICKYFRKEYKDELELDTKRQRKKLKRFINNT
ncbi:hypothetical protein KKE60_08930 [Patescibacteria group bacterium]|nr:hypothetical protein [Patescibacteria group bacterium]